MACSRKEAPGVFLHCVPETGVQGDLELRPGKPHQTPPKGEVQRQGCQAWVEREMRLRQKESPGRCQELVT